MRVLKRYPILIVLILLSSVAQGLRPLNKAAVIFSGDEFYHEGTQLRASLLEKGYDVHLAEVLSKRPLRFEDWSSTKLGKELNDHYTQLLFIVTAHGLREFGAMIYWDSLLKLVKLFEKKSENIFIHLETCHSGDAAKKWVKEIGNHVTIFTASSCPDKSTAYSPAFWNHTNVLQIFTGYYLTVKNSPGRIGNINEDTFSKLTCDATLSEVVGMLDKPCSLNTCYKVHIHRGNNEKLKDWNLLPINLALAEDSIKLTEDKKFADGTCEVPKRVFDDQKTISFKSPLDVQKFVNYYDPVKNWKVRTNHVPKQLPVPWELKDNVPMAHSTILRVNGEKCNILGSRYTKENCHENIKNAMELTVGYYETRDIWRVDKQDEDYIPFDYTIIIYAAVGVGLVIAVGGFLLFCCRRSAKKRPTPLYNNQEIYRRQYPHQASNNTIQRQVRQEDERSVTV